MKKIYILTVVSLEADGCLSFDTLVYNTYDEAESFGNELLDQWVAEHCEEDENGELTGVNVTRGTYFAEAMSTYSIAEFDYNISEFEV